MSFESTLLKFSYPASADLSAKQYRFVKITSLQLAVCARGDKALGILQDKPAAAGRAGVVGFSGVTKVVLGGSVTAGNDVISDANGAGVVAASSDNNIMGVALETGASGDIIAMLLQPRGLS